ncbi:MAG TPA: YigZ family protein [Flavipsychrobacter sp.]|nr:YigZ family protein [Flavipsychrobacter sp.]
MTADYTFKTIENSATAEFKDRGSKFLAYLFPVKDENDVKKKLKEVKLLHPKAVHHCYAYRLGIDGNRYRANDDGEPSGSAGKPILGQIDSAGVTNVLAIVARYFGGTLLGVPGLINAYKTVTAEAFQNTLKIERWIEMPVELEFDYPVMSEVLYLLKQSDATIYEQELQLFCTIQAGIPKKQFEHYLQRLSEIRGVKIKQL